MSAVKPEPKPTIDLDFCRWLQEHFDEAMELCEQGAQPEPAPVAPPEPPPIAEYFMRRRFR